MACSRPLSLSATVGSSFWSSWAARSASASASLTVCSRVPAIFEESSMSLELLEARRNCCSMSSSSSGLSSALSISSTWNLRMSSSCSVARSEFLRSSRRMDFSCHSL